MKKYIWPIMVALLLAGLASCDITTGQFTIVITLDGIASTDDDVHMEVADLNEEQVYVDHRDDIRNIESVTIVAHVVNNSIAMAQGEIWVSTNSTYTTADEIRNSEDARRVFISPPIAVGGELTIDWQNGFSHMENVEYLEDLIINEGVFTVYGLASATPFDVYMDAEIVITFTAG
jgi:hypothetical protein